MKLEEKINEGRLREVYRDGNFVFKTMKPKVKKRILGLNITLNSKPYSLLRFGLLDLNKHEYNVYSNIKNKIPSNLSDCFAKIHRVTIYNNQSVSKGELITNSDGTVSKRVADYTEIKSPLFYEKLEQIKEFFLSNNIPADDLSFNNVLVKELENKEMIPVVQDYKRMNIRTLIFRPSFLLRKKSFYNGERMINKIKEKYKPKEKSK